MQEGITRRRLLRGAAALGGCGAAAGSARGQEHSDTGGFTPDEHGFGFRNWSPRSQYFDRPADLTTAGIRETVQTGWRDWFRNVLGSDATQLPSPLIDAIATHLRTAIVQLAGTNGHCYGMVLAAQQYFEQPDSIPVDRRSASEIENPTVPVDQPEAPVYDDIVQLQATQYLRFRAWLGRRALAHPAWIDRQALLTDIRSVVEQFGSASLLLFNGELYGHQVLAYDYHERGDGAAIPIYDPNRTAMSYRDGTPTLRFEHDGEGVIMQPYRTYTGVLFNRYDRIERVPGREDASPLDHLTVDRATVGASLFPVAVVLVDSDSVDLAVVDPDGEPLERIRGTHMDRNRGEAARMRVRYGAAPGTYRISVFGTRSTEYEVRVVVSGLDGEIVNETHTAQIEAGAVDEYTLELPESGDGALSLDNGGNRGAGVVGGVGAVGGVAAGALGYRVVQGRRTRDSAIRPGP